MVSTSLVTRSAAALEMDTPSQILIKPSRAEPEKLGVWCKEFIKEGTKFGPFVGEKAYEVDDNMDPAYIWEIVDIETKEFLFYINATKDSGNWMRHIKCARFFEEQNIVSEQEGIDIFYQAIKDISPGEELLTWFEKSPLRRKKGKRRAYQTIKRAKSGKLKAQAPRHPAGSTKSDVYADVNYISQRGRKRSVKKYWQMEGDSDASPDAEKPEDSEEDDLLQEVSDEDIETTEVKSSTKTVGEEPEETVPVESETGFFQFELQVTQTGKNRLGRRVFQCDICSGIYRHSFSLKRHYIRNHINYKYVSKVDRLNCSIVCESEEPLDETEEGLVEAGDATVNCINEVKAEESAGEELEKEPGSNSADGAKTILKKKDVTARESKISAAEDAEVPVTESSTVKNSSKQDASNPESTDNQDKVTASLSPSPDSSETVKAENETEGGAESKGKYLLPGLYRCNICEELYNTVEQLKEHFLNHPNFPSDKKFACEHCKMKFKHKQNLMRHEVVHTGAKPYICNHCNKRFPTLTNQKRHERIHKGQKFTCSQCPGTFTQTGDLKKHMCKQHPETYNECGYCSKYFSSESVLAGHLQKVHSKDIEANHQKICARKKAHKVSLEKDRAESRRLASDHSKTDPSLQFACTICRKRFRDYSNMCRHRRLAHEREAANLELRWGNCDEGTLADGDGYFSDTDSQPDGEKADALQTYFSGVSRNISNNLQNFIEGKEEQLTKASCHIRWKQKNTMEKLAATEKGSDINLEEFNFPQGFKIRQLSELYESPVMSTSQTLMTETSSKSITILDNKSSSSLEVDTDSNSDSSGKSGNKSPVGEKPCVLPLAIRVPEIKSCSLCHSSFHDTAALISHMDESHRSQCKDDILGSSNHNMVDDCTPVNYSTKCPQPGSAPVEEVKSDYDEQPLDLSVPSTPLLSAELSTIKPTLVPMESGRTNETVPECSEIQCRTRKETPALSKKFLCLVCFSEFTCLADLNQHQSERHASIDCRHAEVDLNFNMTWFRQPNPVGVLNVSSSQLPEQYEDKNSTNSLSCVCTKCKSEFCSSEMLHKHIADCGDYWRHLNTRITWVFVLRGSELPMEKVVKKRGKFHWSNSPEESSRRQLQRMLLQQHLGDNPLDNSPTSKGRLGRSVARTKSFESLDDESDLRRNRWRHSHQSAYNPRRHVRRREMAELVDVQKCRGCGEEFKTIVQLERHIPVCMEKNRIKDLHVEKAENGENSDEGDDYDPSKHMCIYCERQFTYLRMLKKHIVENCSVRKEFVEKREYIDEEWEQEINSKVQTSSRDSGQSFNESVGGEEGDTSDSRRIKRRKRGNNWGCRARTKKSFKSSKSSDDGDSLFGWEDAVLNNVTKKEGNHVKISSGIVDATNEGENCQILQKPDDGTLFENTNAVVNVSPALQKLLVSDFNSNLAETGEKPKTEELQPCPGNSEEVLDAQTKQMSPVSPEFNNKESSLPQQDVCEGLKSSSLCSDALQLAREDVSTANVKQKLVTKIRAKRTVKRKLEQTDRDVVDSKFSPDDVEQKNTSTTEETVTGINNVSDRNPENGDDVVREESKQDNEGVQSVRVRKRRGPRLTMKSKKRKTVSSEPKAKARPDRQRK